MAAPKKNKGIPISAARAIAKDYRCDQIIILGRKCGENGIEHLTTYGITKAHCSAAAVIGNFLKTKVMGWVSNA